MICRSCSHCGAQGERDSNCCSVAHACPLDFTEAVMDEPLGGNHAAQQHVASWSSGHDAGGHCHDFRVLHGKWNQRCEALTCEVCLRGVASKIQEQVLWPIPQSNRALDRACFLRSSLRIYIYTQWDLYVVFTTSGTICFQCASLCTLWLRPPHRSAQHEIKTL